jgi:hypothetical protein
MSQLFEDRPAPPPLSYVWRGIVASHPSDVSERINVKIPDMNKDLVFPNVRWQTRDSTSLPDRGDACLVVFDNDREPWVVAWWPFA